ncbi:MAG: hypothetical protein COB36_09920 [Alphaproteobacteria bacterium]|nr:MAG: hypothetical protein COB36_09920 [Alphaproteobacteria bacterium]
MAKDSDILRQKLLETTRLSAPIIDAAWPDWWDQADEGSISAQVELRFSLARKLGLEPQSLLNEDTPRFAWKDSGKYKNFSGDEEHEKPAISSFGISVSNLLLQSLKERQVTGGLDLSASSIREAILSTKPHIGIPELLTFLWGISVPVIHLRLFPLAAKRMCAMATKTQDQFSILLAKDARYPAPLAFHIAHEIGHIVLNHLGEFSAIVDMEDPAEGRRGEDLEEIDADKFALELLTGFPDPPIEVVGEGKSSRRLAKEAFDASEKFQIEPGTVSLCYGYQTGNWDVANGAMKHIYAEPMDVWKIVNAIAIDQLDLNLLPEESSSFLRAILGGDI